MELNEENPVSNYFRDFVKGNMAKLRQFIAAMPKGADLHHHLTGAAYAETLFSIACENNLYVNLETGKLYSSIPANVEIVQLSSNMDNFHSVRMSLIDKWSVRNYHPYKYPLGADEYFFSLFGDFGAATNEEYLPEIVHQLKVRAKEENVQYIETMGIRPKVPEFAYLDKADYDRYTEKLTDFCLHYNDNPEGNEKKIFDCLNEVLIKFIGNKDLDEAVNSYIVKCIKILTHESLKTNSLKIKKVIRKFDTVNVADNDDDVMMRLQGYADRNKTPLDVFCQLYIVHRAMLLQKNIPGWKWDIIVGCNLVSAENSENSMLYYKAHMIMFKVLKEKLFKDNQSPNVSLHAGELTMGLIPPEHLTYHVTDAVEIAGAKRIGHGVDIAFEHLHKKNGDVNIYGNVLEKMKADTAQELKLGNGVPVEINLTSNEFILGVKDDAHPFKIYKDSGIPIIISTDDPGILRTSLTEEYTLAAYRYDLSYEDLKQIVYNSVQYSFLSDDEKYGNPTTGICGLKAKVDQKFDDFENYIKSIIPKMP